MNCDNCGFGGWIDYDSPLDEFEIEYCPSCGVELDASTEDDAPDSPDPREEDVLDLDNWTNDIHAGDAAETLAKIPESSVHMVMTSPPYFGLRDYDEDGQIGLEKTLDEFIANLITVFREVRRVLRPDGSVWLNMGDGYDTNGDILGLGKKQKMMVPHRLGIALQNDGWIVRNDATWVKPNAMPHSVKDRLNTTTEQVFHLTPEPDYWYDLDSIREPHAESSLQRLSQNDGNPVNNPQDQGHPDGEQNLRPEDLAHPEGKNPGDVFEVLTKPFPEAHFAVYPPELVEKPLKATCPPTVCAACGAPYEREVELGDLGVSSADHDPAVSQPNSGNGETGLGGDGRQSMGKRERHLKGWVSTCDCDTDATEPGIALDPFAGAGTTCLVAKRHGRRFIGIDLNEEYVAMAQKRLGLTVDHPEHIREDESQAGQEEWL